jgi:hypothetical protein
MAVGMRHADHVAPSIRKSWQSLRRQAAVGRSVGRYSSLATMEFFLWRVDQIINPVGMTPWTGDQPVGRPLLRYRT